MWVRVAFTCLTSPTGANHISEDEKVHSYILPWVKASERDFTWVRGRRNSDLEGLTFHSGWWSLV